MGINDLLITPLYFLLLYIVFIVISARYKNNPEFKRYFIFAFLSRVIGGLCFAFIYLFYYEGGDTLNYYTDSLMITKILLEDPLAAIGSLFSFDEYLKLKMSEMSLSIYFINDAPSLTIGKIGGFFNLITLNSFICDTILFSIFGFMGCWKLFLTLSKIYPSITKQIAIACLYIPSVIFWGSGMMKDTICLFLLCYIFSYTVEIFILKSYSHFKVIKLLIFSALLINIKIYIFMSFVFPLLFLYALRIGAQIKSVLLRTLVVYPILILITSTAGYYIVSKISEGDAKYSLENIEETAKITSDYIGRISLQQDGSYYSLGKLDFTLSNLPALIVKSFIVTFYRPFPWEIKNPLMVLASAEGLFFMYLTYLTIRALISRKKTSFTPFIIYAIIFSVLFAFIVGITSSNFGTLVRYKIPVLPFFACGVYVLIHNAKSPFKNI